MTHEQLAIIRQPPAARQLVTAGPGTGKTHVLIGRLMHLVTVHALQPGADIAVLTFSRAAVREIRDRLAGAEGAVAYVRATTFDSLATRLLSEYEPGGPWVGWGYEKRIQAADSLLRRDEAAQERISRFGHVLVDEMQDLVGLRADFVFTILKLAGGGFTALGDPAQAIYNFQLEGAAREDGSADLYRRVRGKFAPTLIEVSLTQNHRAQTPGAKTALWAGALLNAEEPVFAHINDELLAAVNQLHSLGRLETACPRLARVKERTAILCRTNGQALMISRKLFETGLNHTFQRSASERAFPSWIGRIFSGFEIKKIGRDSFIEKAFGILDQANALRAWDTLQRAQGGRGQVLDLGHLADLLRSGNVPDDLLDFSVAQLVVSTIHRAKGLEFDRVVLAVRPGDFCAEDPGELAEATRVLYVALTRPKRELQHLELEAFRGIQEHPRTGRWIRSYGPGKLKDVEVVADDAHSDDPGGTFPSGAFPAAADARETQRYLAEHVKRGEPVALKRLRVSQDGEPRAVYSIEHNERVIGVTSETFGQALYRILKINPGWKVQWPVRIEQLRIDDVDTVAGSDVAGRRHGLGTAGLWLRPRIAGLGALHFDAASI